MEWIATQPVRNGSREEICQFLSLKLKKMNLETLVISQSPDLSPQAQVL